MDTLRQSPILKTFAYLVAISACMIGLLILRELEPANKTLTIHGFYDKVGHLITALIAAIGIRALRLPVPIWSVLLGGMVLDLGHVPQIFGYVGSIEGSSRNGSHSLAVVVFLASMGFIDRRRANIYLGIAIGAVSHLWRDMGTGTVALIWPITETVYGTLYSRYIAVLTGIAVAMVGSAGLLGVHSQTLSQRKERPTALPR